MAKKSTKQRKKEKALNEAKPVSRPPSLLMRPVATTSAATTSHIKIEGLPKTPGERENNPFLEVPASTGANAKTSRGEKGANVVSQPIPMATGG